MNYTPNYQLPQWVESDRVLMEDFNASNTKLDTALAQLASKEAWKELASASLSAAGHSISLNVPTSEISRQQLVLIRVSISMGAGLLTVNGGGRRFPAVSGGSWLSNGVMEVVSDAPAWMLIPIGKTSAGKMRGIALGDHLYYVACDVTPSAWSTLTLTSMSDTTNLPYGSKIQLFGCK